MVNVIYNKKTDCPFGKLKVERVIKLAANYEKKISGTVEGTVVSEKKIKQLNKDFRGKDKVTDVLSFSMREGGEVTGPFFGELYLCYRQIKRQAESYGVAKKEEFTRMLVHGLLHLSGYDHQKKNEAKKMFALQEKIVVKALNKV